MKGYLLAVTVASSLALAFVVGCGSSSGGNGGAGGSGGKGGSGGSGNGGGFNCDYTLAGYEECFSYSGLPAAEMSALDSSCKGTLKGTTPSSCPSANQTGCCENISVGSGTTGYTYGYCYYKEPMSALAALKTACESAALKGTWKD